MHRSFLSHIQAQTGGDPRCSSVGKTTTTWLVMRRVCVMGWKWDSGKSSSVLGGGEAEREKEREEEREKKVRFGTEKHTEGKVHKSRMPIRGDEPLSNSTFIFTPTLPHPKTPITLHQILCVCARVRVRGWRWCTSCRSAGMHTDGPRCACAGALAGHLGKLGEGEGQRRLSE